MRNEAIFPSNPNKQKHLFLLARTHFRSPEKLSERFRTMAVGLQG
jgi:hypothetical protein